jgi:hypothetical protein
MKKTILFITTIIGLFHFACAQKKDDQVITLKPTITLTIDRTGGASAAGIVWHPLQKKYYAAQAGNADFPMIVFDAKGKKLSGEDLSTGVDIRGFWYDPATRTMRANTYDNEGWYEFKLNDKGMPVAQKKLPVETSQPDPQSVGAFSPLKRTVYFFDYENVSLETHNMDGSVGLKKTQLYLGISDKADNTPDDLQMDTKVNYNTSTIVFTGLPHREIGLLNVTEKQVELYDLESGLMTKTLKLPSDAPAESMLNFSYANGIYWLFDTKARIWHGYK